ncbi:MULTISPECIES: hypothetical protein [Streptomyces]|uniref:hypothetical protein n=1 Tax=Streptomyces TaxID=1883 RepID=UPI002253EE82|nr:MULTISPECIES: hypothetical protein [Streptomyces]MCX4636897.1 abortive infection family protein [Streptomyces platensis]WSX22269.1 abortive infection family protein [Streptomyces tubercidicus]
MLPNLANPLFAVIHGGWPTCKEVPIFAAPPPADTLALRGLNIEIDRDAALPALISTVQKALKLDAGSAPDGPDGSKTVKKIPQAR